MKAILLSLLVLAAPASFAEGVASTTAVTAANGKSLAHHGLAVICKSQQGKTFVDLIFRPRKENPFVACSVTIHDERGEKILVQIDPEIHRAPKLEGLPDGSRVFFHVADEWVDCVEVMYQLHANEFQTHVFTIKTGELRKLAGVSAAETSPEPSPAARLQAMWRDDLSKRDAFKPHMKLLAQQISESDRLKVRDTTGDEVFTRIDGTLRASDRSLILAGDLAALRKQPKLTEIHHPGDMRGGFAAYLAPDGTLVLLWIIPEG